MKRLRALLFFVVSPMVLTAHAEAIPPELTKTISALSQKAAELKMGMSHKEVLHILGDATWAALPRDGKDYILPDPSVALSLYWKNPGCVPVAVDFDRQHKLVGWNQGRLCLDGAERLEPPAKYDCNKKDRNKFCKNQ